MGSCHEVTDEGKGEGREEHKPSSWGRVAFGVGAPSVETVGDGVLDVPLLYM